ncbi:ABC transporter substrate-binding protein [Methylocella sp.]|uniref:ABC transporter substrate-binding protein n=1 Tax=Methylocella sp. TaxID=1978226 RepID=UPI00378307B4
MSFFRLTRRDAAFAAAAALACAALPAAVVPAAAETKIKIGYIPVLGSSQLFVIEGEGWAKAEGLDLDLVRFGSGPQAMQALAAGQLDAYLAGVLPLLVARSKGVDVKVVAAGAIEELQLVGRGALVEAAKASGGDMKAAFAAFTKAQGRKPKLAAQPAGSVPDTLLRYWLEQTGVDAASVDIASIDIDAAQQAFLASSVDAAVLREPAVTVALDRVKDAKILVDGHQFMPDQPGSALAFYKPQALIDSGVGAKLLKLHIRATAFLKNEPDRAAPHILAALGSGLLTEAQIKSALKGSRGTFVADPARIVDSVAKLQDFQVKLGVVRRATPVAELFDLDLYRRVAP